MNHWGWWMARESRWYPPRLWLPLAGVLSLGSTLVGGEARNEVVFLLVWAVTWAAWLVGGWLLWVVWAALPYFLRMLSDPWRLPHDRLGGTGTPGSASTEKATARPSWPSLLIVGGGVLVLGLTLVGLLAFSAWALSRHDGEPESREALVARLPDLALSLADLPPGFEVSEAKWGGTEVYQVDFTGSGDQPYDGVTVILSVLADTEAAASAVEGSFSEVEDSRGEESVIRIAPDTRFSLGDDIRGKVVPPLRNDLRFYWVTFAKGRIMASIIVGGKEDPGLSKALNLAQRQADRLPKATR